MKGYAINEKRLQALEKTVDIQTRMLADALGIEDSDVLRAVNEYIDASLFLEFLDKNNSLFEEGRKRLSDGTLVAITLMIAESKPEKKDIMIKLVMNLLNL
mgnify:FL=1